MNSFDRFDGVVLPAQQIDKVVRLATGQDFARAFQQGLGEAVLCPAHRDARAREPHPRQLGQVSESLHIHVFIKMKVKVGFLMDQCLQESFDLRWVFVKCNKMGYPHGVQA